tara:strand:- start:340 stop:471 length:132 start_codon:yes stop_codon:yes gene_type:complete
MARITTLLLFVATGQLGLGFRFFVRFALTFGKGILVSCDNDSP